MTSHGLFHERLDEVYREVANEASPIQGGGKVDRETDDAARQEVAEVADHCRLQIAGYVGGRL